MTSSARTGLVSAGRAAPVGGPPGANAAAGGGGGARGGGGGRGGPAPGGGGRASQGVGGGAWGASVGGGGCRAELARPRHYPDRSRRRQGAIPAAGVFQRSGPPRRAAPTRPLGS